MSHDQTKNTLLELPFDGDSSDSQSISDDMLLLEQIEMRFKLKESEARALEAEARALEAEARAIEAEKTAYDLEEKLDAMTKSLYELTRNQPEEEEDFELPPPANPYEDDHNTTTPLEGEVSPKTED